jgi:hypothetical protein
MSCMLLNAYLAEKLLNCTNETAAQLIATFPAVVVRYCKRNTCIDCSRLIVPLDYNTPGCCANVLSASLRHPPSFKMLALSSVIFCLYWFIHAARSQTVNVSTAQPIISSSGACLSAFSSTDGAPIYFTTCDNSAGQKWDISTSGPHIIDSGFAIIILSGVCSNSKKPSVVLI